MVNTQGLMYATLGLGIGILLTFLAVIVLIVASNWKIFVKAGESGWKALIPYYNTYILCKISKVPTLFIAWIIFSVIGLGFNFYDNLWIETAGELGTFVVSILISINLGKAFNKSTGFIVGLVLLPIIFYPILAFGSSVYDEISN